MSSRLRQPLRVLGLVLLALAVGAVCVQALRPGSTPKSTVATVPVQPEPAQPSVLFVGDDYTGGFGGPGVASALSCLTANAMRWVCNVDAQAGTGYVNNGHAYDRSFQRLIERLPRTKSRFLADVVIVDAGRYDDRFAVPRVERAIKQYLSAVRDAWPRAEIVVIAPYRMASTAPPFGETLQEILRTETERVRGNLIDPLEAGWIDPAVTGRMTAEDKFRPNAEGHRYLSRKLVAALRDLGLAKVKVTDTRGAAAP